LTLIMTLFKPSVGIWQSSDHRVSIRGTPSDDDSIKHVALTCPDGRSMLCYTGPAELEDGTHISDWIRSTLRGENRTVEGHLMFLAERASRDIGQSPRLRRTPLVIAVGAIGGEYSWYYEITNAQKRQDWALRPGMTKFRIAPFRVDEDWLFVGGSGISGITLADRELLMRVLRRHPNRVANYSGLLAAVNRRAPDVTPK
jgi:hypothetical protein